MSDALGAQVVSASRRGFKTFDVRVEGLPAALSVSADGPRATDLVLAGLVACSGRTFDQIAGRMRVEIGSVELTATAERSSDPPELFTRIRLDWDVVSPADPQRIVRALELTEKHCTVLNLLRASAEIEVRHRIRKEEARTA